MYAGESDAEPRGVAGAILAEGYRGTGFDQLLVGGADSVVQDLRRYRDMGFDYVMVRHIVGDHQLMLRPFERIGRDVMPRIRDFVGKAGFPRTRIDLTWRGMSRSRR